MKVTEKKIWFRSLENEFGRLAQGVGTRIKGTNTLTFIPKIEGSFSTKRLHMDRLYVIYDQINQKHMEVD